MTETDYVLDSASTLGRQQLSCLETLYDGLTEQFLVEVGVGAGSRCLDIGAGAGSISQWLAQRVGPDGRVVAVDIAADHLTGTANLSVVRHDINDGVPDGGPYDLIHARLVLMHLPRREELLRMLVDALRPGGRLVIGEAEEYGTRPTEVLSARSSTDVQVFNRVVNATINTVGRAAGIDYEWVHRLGGALVDAGLDEVRASAFRSTTAGGLAGAALNANYVRQVQSLVLDAGVTEQELSRFYELSSDPEFRTWAMPLTYFTGRKPQARASDSADD